MTNMARVALHILRPPSNHLHNIRCQSDRLPRIPIADSEEFVDHCPRCETAFDELASNNSCAQPMLDEDLKMLCRTRPFLAFMVLAMSCTGPSMAAEPQLAKLNLFEAGKGDYALYRIPGLVVTAKGTVLAYCEARRTGKSDWDTIDILLRRSTDGGKTWSPRVKIADVPGPKTKNPVALAQKLANPEDVTYNNPVAFANRDGSVQFLFCLEYCRCFSMRSDDDGVTWTKPVEITATFDKFRPEYNWKVLATGPGHGIQLKSGRLVVPVWLSTGTGGHAHRPSVTSTIFSDDNGRTWQRGEIAVPNTNEWFNPNETVVVQLADGRVMLNVRSESKTHRRLVTISPDGATGWSKPRFDNALLEPICMASIIRLSEQPASDKNRIVFANPHNLARADGKEADGKSRDRKNLSIKLSEDDGQTWSIGKVLEPGMSAYSDLAVLPDGTILCLYERGRDAGDDEQKKPTSYALLTLARFNLEWLTAGTVATDRDWNKQDQLNAKLDRMTITDDGQTPNQLVCDTTLRELPDGSWSLYRLAGEDFEPSPKNDLGLTRSTDATTANTQPAAETPQTVAESARAAREI